MMLLLLIMLLLVIMRIWSQLSRRSVVTEAVEERRKQMMRLKMTIRVVMITTRLVWTASMMCGNHQRDKQEMEELVLMKSLVISYRFIQKIGNICLLQYFIYLQFKYFSNFKVDTTFKETLTFVWLACNKSNTLVSYYTMATVIVFCVIF